MRSEAPKHTPGPWVLSDGQWGDHSEDGGGGFHLLMGDYEAADGIGIKSSRLLNYGDMFYPEDTEFAEVEANARLIAAAPDLLQAAQKVLAGLNARIDSAPPDAVPVFDGIAELHDAIEKARSNV